MRRADEGELARDLRRRRFGTVDRLPTPSGELARDVRVAAEDVRAPRQAATVADGPTRLVDELASDRPEERMGRRVVPVHRPVQRDTCLALADRDERAAVRDARQRAEAGRGAQHRVRRRIAIRVLAQRDDVAISEAGGEGRTFDDGPVAPHRLAFGPGDEVAAVVRRERCEDDPEHRQVPAHQRDRDRRAAEALQERARAVVGVDVPGRPRGIAHARPGLFADVVRVRERLEEPRPDERLDLVVDVRVTTATPRAVRSMEFSAQQVPGFASDLRRHREGPPEVVRMHALLRLTSRGRRPWFSPRRQSPDSSDGSRKASARRGWSDTHVAS